MHPLPTLDESNMAHTTPSICIALFHPIHLVFYRTQSAEHAARRLARRRRHRSVARSAAVAAARHALNGHLLLRVRVVQAGADRARPVRAGGGADLRRRRRQSGAGHARVAARLGAVLLSTVSIFILVEYTIF